MPVGVVEGFYGTPWTHIARLDMIDFLGNHGFNIYIYAPKDDPFHRERWAEPYPQPEFARLRNLTTRAIRRDVDFCFALSPGLSMRYSSDEDFERLWKKAAQVAELGVRTFGLFLDDIPPELAHDQDKSKFPSLAEAHVHVANKLLERLKKEYGEVRLILCPTPYWGVEPQDYHRLLGQGLSSEIHVMWTGRTVCSSTITCQDADSYGSGIRRKPFLWDNYPVNDYNRDRLFLGPLKGRDSELLQHLSGYVSNPMNEAEASKFALLTFADYASNPPRYDPIESWKRAVQQILPRELRKAFLAFADHSRASFLDIDESPALSEYVREIMRNPMDADLINRMVRYLHDLRRSIKKLERGLPPKLKKEMRPYLRKGDSLVELGLCSLDLLKSARKTIPKTSKSKRRIQNMLNQVSKDSHQLMGKIKANWTIEKFEQDSYPEQLAKKALEVTKS